MKVSAHQTELVLYGHILFIPNPRSHISHLVPQSLRLSVASAILLYSLSDTFSEQNLRLGAQ